MMSIKLPASLTLVALVTAFLSLPCRAFAAEDPGIYEAVPQIRSLSRSLYCKLSPKGGRLVTRQNNEPSERLILTRREKELHARRIKAAEGACAPRTLFSLEVRQGGRRSTIVDGGVLEVASFSEQGALLRVKNLKRGARSIRAMVDGIPSVVSGSKLGLPAKPDALYLAPGNHALSLRVFSGRNGRGKLLQSGALSFTTVDLTPSALTIIAPSPTIAGGKPLPLVGSTTLPITISFPEPVVGFTERDILLTNGIMNNFIPRNRGTAPDSYSLFTFDFTVRVPVGGSSAEGAISVPAGAAVGTTSSLQTGAAGPFVVRYYATQPPITGATATPTATVVATVPQSTPIVPTSTPTPRPTATTGATPTPTPSPIPRTPTPVATVAAGSCSSELATSTGLLSFPGAEGHGRFSLGGSGRHLKTPCTRVFTVTSLADRGVGTLRECIDGSGPRVCVFETSGMIWATEPLRIRNPYITIAGQTAPSPGITIRGSGIINEASEVVIQHIRLRVGDDPRAECCKTKSCAPQDQLRCTADPGSRDGITTWNTGYTIQKNVIYDHISISWALDEGLSIVPDRADVTNITFSNSIISSGLDMSIHPEANTPGDLGHSKGVLINGAKQVQKLSFLRTLLAHNADRNIRASTPLSMEYINNVAYNWGRGGGAGRTIELTNSVKALHSLDLIGNYYRPGRDTFCPETTYRPETCPQVARNGIDSSADRLRLHSMLRVGSGISSGLNSASRYFLKGNITNTRPDASYDEWKAADKSFFLSDLTTLVYPTNRASTPVASSGSVPVKSTSDGYQSVLLNSGARPADRDIVDARVIEEVRSGTGQIINCVAADGSARCAKNAGGWPVYSVNRRPLSLPLNPQRDDDNDGYTNLEEWLHDHSRLVE